MLSQAEIDYMRSVSRSLQRIADSLETLVKSDKRLAVTSRRDLPVTSEGLAALIQDAFRKIAKD
jgi:hypothetical protein